VPPALVQATSIQEKHVYQGSIRRNDEGASAVEYGLIVFAIAALITVIVVSFGGTVRDLFEGSCNSLKDGTQSSASCTP
jgi:pilus assembly protein Flp/PilA